MKVKPARGRQVALAVGRREYRVRNRQHLIVQLLLSDKKLMRRTKPKYYRLCQNFLEHYLYVSLREKNH
jgi:hypothetical protein